MIEKEQLDLKSKAKEFITKSKKIIIKTKSFIMKSLKNININSIKTKLILAFTLLILLSSTSLAYISITSASNAILSQTKYSLAQLAIDGASMIRDSIDEQLNTLARLANQSEIQSRDWQRQKDFIRRERTNTDFVELLVVLPDGRGQAIDDSSLQLGDRENAQSETSIEEMTRTIEGISIGANEQALSTEAGASKIANLGIAVEENKDYMSQLSRQAARVGDEGRGFAVVAEEVNGAVSNSLASVETMETLKNEILDAIQSLTAIA